MRIEQALQIDEGISDVVFHFTQITSFFDMVGSGSILLSRAKSGEDFGEGFEFFLSTARNKTNSFSSTRPQGVLLTLDGRTLRQNLKGKPVDFFNDTDEFDEMEDRIFSNQREIGPLERFVLKADILLSQRQVENETFRDEIEALKNEGFPVFVFDNRRDWISGRKERARFIVEDGKFRVNLELLLRRRNEN